MKDVSNRVFIQHIRLPYREYLLENISETGLGVTKEKLENISDVVSTFRMGIDVAINKIVGENLFNRNNPHYYSKIIVDMIIPKQKDEIFYRLQRKEASEFDYIQAPENERYETIENFYHTTHFESNTYPDTDHNYDHNNYEVEVYYNKKLVWKKHYDNLDRNNRVPNTDVLVYASEIIRDLDNNPNPTYSLI
jgi:hypothetical protein